jgi:predicted dinucleotide-binding enzyme
MNRNLVVAACTALILCTPIDSLAEQETIAIIGTGDLGDSLGQSLADLGYSVIYGSRKPNSEKAAAVIAKTGNGAIAVSQKEAARRGDIVFLPINWPAMESVAHSLGNLDGKIVIDPSVPWTQGEDGYPTASVDPSSAELIQQWNPGAKVVKAFGTMGSMIIDEPDAAGGLVTIPVASDHRDAKERVARLIHEMGHDPVDFGPLRMARSIEAMGVIYMIPLIRHQKAEWEFYFRRNADWACKFREEWAEPVYDADDRAEMPSSPEPPVPCP